MSESNPNARLEAFCDGVFAIAITLLIIEVRIPSDVPIANTAEFWHALAHIAPLIYAFLLSFMIILIVWVNHHLALKLAAKASPRFWYANGLLLLGVVFIPFPTSLLGEHLFSNHAAPAVMLYNSALAIQAMGWIAICRVALKEKLYKDPKHIPTIKENERYSYLAFALYGSCIVVAYWFPLATAIVTTTSWIFWLIVGLRIKHE